MIKKLQKKFIKTAMIAITILLVVVLCCVNIFNTVLTNKQAERLVDNLVTKEILMQMIENDQSRPQMPGNIDAPAGGDFGMMQQPEPGKGFLQPPINEDMQLGAIYFTVSLTEDYKIAKIDASHIASVTADDAEKLIKNIKFEKKTSGTVKTFKYKAAEYPAGDGTVAVFMDTSIQIYSIVRVAVLSLLIGIACWIVMFGVVTLLSKQAIKPIAVNMEKQKQFVTDAGHEIKTPLAVILANTEAMELKTGETKHSKNIREQVWRLNDLMQNLLTLAKVDEEENKTVFKETSVSSIVLEMTDMFREPAMLRNIEIDEDVQTDIRASVDRTQISNLVSILMDNAVKYSSENDTVYISLKKEEKKIVLRTKNNCDKLPDCEPSKLFDRFYRPDSARTQSSGGNGIGLSAAAAIVENHKGEITAAYTGEKEITFTVILPA